MKISTEIGSAARHVGEERAVEYIAKAGFDAWDFSMFEMCGYDWGTKTALKSDHPLAGGGYLSFARKLRRWERTTASCAISRTRPSQAAAGKSAPIFSGPSSAPRRRGDKSASSIRITINRPRKTRTCTGSCCPLPKGAASKSPPKTCGTGTRKRTAPPSPPAPRRRAFARICRP